MQGSTSEITRREALASMLSAAGFATLAGSLPLLASSCVSEDPWVPATLSAEQDQLVTVLAETIIPETDTPGAAAAQVNRYIDLMLSQWHEPDNVKIFMDGLVALDEDCQSQYGFPFSDLTHEQRVAILTDYESRESEEESMPTFFLLLKEMTIVGYYTSEIGGTIELIHFPVPGKFDACVPLAEVGRTWA